MAAVDTYRAFLPVHLNDAGRNPDTGAYLVACATRGITDPARVTRETAGTTCLRCRGTVRFMIAIRKEGRR